MTNKYLTKISGVFGSTLKAGVGLVADVAKGVGKDVHLAVGGGYRDAAAAKGITSQNTLRGISNSKSYLQATKPKLDNRLKQISSDYYTRAVGADPSNVGKDARKSEVKGLQQERNKAILKTVGYTAVGAVGAGKVIDKIKSSVGYPQDPQTQQYY